MSQRVFPPHGVVWKTLEQELFGLRTHDPAWENSFCFWGWPNPGSNIHVIAKDAQAMFYNQFWMGRRSQPSGEKLVRDLQQMTRDILCAPDEAHVSLTSGGTESNFSAVLSAREFARKARPDISNPNIVVPYSAHPSFDKAGFYLGIDVVRVPITKEFRANVEALSDAIDERTIMLVGSAPAYPHGLCDPIGDIGELALGRNIWFHVDACVGGFLLPFLQRLRPETPQFDFRLPGVRSISADLHKFGYVPTGLSTLTLRNASDYEHTVFKFSDWPHGEYKTDSFAGSRTTSIVAAAWTVLKTLGEDGYLRLARQLLHTSDKLRSAIAKIGDLRMTAEPEAGIFVFSSARIDVRALARTMTARGFPSFCVNDPPAVHLLLQPAEDERHVDLYINALAESYSDVENARGNSAGVDLAYA